MALGKGRISRKTSYKRTGAMKTIKLKKIIMQKEIKEQYEVFSPSGFDPVFIKYKNRMVSGQIVFIPNSFRTKNYKVKLENGRVLRYNKDKDFFRKTK